MTSKRFILFEDLDIKDKATGKIYPPCLDRGLSELIILLNEFDDDNKQSKALIKALKKSNIDYINQIRKAYEENLSIEELADNCGVDLK